jgi:maltooligosyltrehalose synthase
VPILLFSLKGQWQNTAVDFPSGEWLNVFTQENFQGRVELKNLFRRFPIALLTAERRKDG